MQQIIDFLKTPIERESLGFRYNTPDVIPDGWKELVDVTFHLASRLVECQVERIAVDKGLLRITVDCKLNIEQVIFDKFAQAVARDSSTMCMECGNRGFRRKEEEFWPSLCGVHYVEYVNFLDSITRDS